VRCCAIAADAQFSLLGPYWSLSSEWQFYGLIALLSIRFRPNTDGLPTLVWIFLGLALTGRAYAVLAPLDWQFHRAFLPNEAGYFALGIAAARFWRGVRAVNLFLVALLITIALGARHGSDGPMMEEKSLPLLIWALVVSTQHAPERRCFQPVATVLGHPAVQWLGAISWPFYLLNEPVSRALALIIGMATDQNKLWFSLLWLPLSLALSIGLAALRHYQVERRFMRTRRPAVAMAASAQ
jgi:peptidoglycan/LPS O-acetylase OafA/YrhL